MSGDARDWEAADTVADDEPGFPRTITLRGTWPRVLAWAHANRAVFADALHASGALLLRDVPIEDPAAFEELTAALVAGGPVEYREPATPRSHVGGSVFTSTELAEDREIFPHNENGHVTTFPAVLAFHCARAPEQGGATVVTDNRAVLRDVPDRVRERFADEGLLYQRAFGYGAGFGWQQVFGVDDRDEAERYFAAHHMTATWSDDRKLRVRYRRWGLVGHPVDGAATWFNNAAFYHRRALEPRFRRFADRLGTDRMPHAVFWADGEEIPDPVMDEVIAAYRRHSTEVAWRPGDVLLLDNVAAAHGRRPYRGDRRVHVLMRRRLAAADLADARLFEVSR